MATLPLAFVMVHAASDDSGRQCQNGRYAMPACEQCIPGLLGPKCARLSAVTTAIRAEMEAIRVRRYGKRGGAFAGKGLYPYLESAQLQGRQALIGQWMVQEAPRVILDIGPYVSPISLWLRHCPEHVIAIEPRGELITHVPGQPWLSTLQPCPVDPSRSFLFTVAPTTMHEFVESTAFRRTAFDAVVCMGCDAHYGPSFSDLMSIQPPFDLYTEHPPKYLPSAQMASAVRRIPGCAVREIATLDLANSSVLELLDRNSRRYSTIRFLEHLSCSNRSSISAAGRG